MTSYSFSGHETFSLRDGWLKKGVDAVSQNAGLFSADEAMIRLGVGKNMVKSIRHWALATQIVEMSPERRGDLVPSYLGQLIFSEDGLDPYAEDIATLWLLHWHLTTNTSMATTWYWMFNLCSYSEFTKDKIHFELKSWLSKLGDKVVSDNTLGRDIDCFVRTYTSSRHHRTVYSEDSLDCPLAELNLVSELDDGKTYQFERGSHDSLPDEVFVYALEKFWQRKANSESISLSRVMADAGGPGRIFKLDEDSVVRRLENIEEVSSGCFIYDETAGLKQIYRRGETDLASLLEKCYEEQRLD